MTPLSERLAALTGPDRKIDAEVHFALFPDTSPVMRDAIRYHPQLNLPRWTSDLSAVVAEIERKGWIFKVAGPFHDVFHGLTYYDGSVWEGRDVHAGHHEAIGPTPSLALLSALVAAVEAELQNQSTTTQDQQ